VSTFDGRGVKARESVVVEGYRERAVAVRAFFEREAAPLAELCLAMARRFSAGGRLIAFGAGAAASDAQHVAVEFVHPVIVGKRALPALALVNDVGSIMGLALRDGAGSFARQLGLLGAPGDIAMGLSHGRRDSGSDAVRRGLERAASIGMLTVHLRGGDGGPSPAEHCFEVDCDDHYIVQEVHETLYHVLWELVHVFFEHKGLLGDRPSGRAHDTGASSFLYPFLSEAETDVGKVLREVGGSIMKKAEDVISLRESTIDPVGLVDSARLVSERIEAGGKVLAFGNGGSATDAQDLVADLLAPPDQAAPIPALSLPNDTAVITAVGNDVGFDNVFARQVIAYGDAGDVAVAISTSGGSRNVLAAVEEARRRGLLTIAFAGYGGGRLAEVCDRAHVVDADYIPRIQEAQATQYHLLRTLLG
jgi:D-sedoheptulose 7-phosphate isomerase